jgi:cytoskeletal protein CcmA (bactofilin family)
MFRRKGEDSLFDNATDTTQSGEGSGAGAASGNSGSGNSASGSGSAASAPTTGTTSGTAPSTYVPPSSTAPRATSETRPASAQGSSVFRPNSSAMGGDMVRSRMPDAKVSNTAATGIGIDKSNKSGRRVLTVGNDILLKGEIATCDRLVIEGKVDATLNDVHTVEIAETGSFKGSANIEDAEISGLFEGDLVVRNRLVIYATGKVRGKISYGEIEIERGGELTGEIKTTTPQSTAARPARAGTKEDKMVAA